VERGSGSGEWESPPCGVQGQSPGRGYGGRAVYSRPKYRVLRHKCVVGICECVVGLCEIAACSRICRIQIL